MVIEVEVGMGKKNRETSTPFILQLYESDFEEKQEMHHQ